MSLVLDKGILRLRDFASRRFGLHFDDAKAEVLEEILGRRVAQTRSSGAEGYLARLLGGEWKDEERSLAEALTITETYFFRNVDQFRALIDVVIPELLQTRPASQPIRLLSAACASGEEAYTLAILLQERFPELGPGRISIRAIDLNPAMLAKAARGRYGSWSLRDAPEELVRKYFRPEGRDFQLSSAILSRVSFEERNLSLEDRSFWAPGSFDVIFCRNVLMYFEPDVMRAIVAREARALEPGGYLFLGHSDTLRGVSDDFELCNTHGTFYYRLRAGGSAEPRETASGPVDAAAWMNEISHACGRIRKMADDPQVPAASPSPATAASAAPMPAADPLEQVTELLRLERYDDALAGALRISAEQAPSVPLMTLKAVLFIHTGQVERAQALCQEILDHDNLNAGAHYLAGLCLEEKGNALEAVERYLTSAYLDPEFSMPRFRLGMILRRSGDKLASRRQLDQALDLIPRETSSRLTLFSAGFGCGGLMELCRSELRLAGGRP